MYKFIYKLQDWFRNKCAYQETLVPACKCVHKDDCPLGNADLHFKCNAEKLRIKVRDMIEYAQQQQNDLKKIITKYS